MCIENSVKKFTVAINLYVLRIMPMKFDIKPKCVVVHEQI